MGGGSRRSSPAVVCCCPQVPRPEPIGWEHTPCPHQAGSRRASRSGSCEPGDGEGGVRWVTAEQDPEGLSSPSGWSGLGEQSLFASRPYLTLLRNARTSVEVSDQSSGG